MNERVVSSPEHSSPTFIANDISPLPQHQSLRQPKPAHTPSRKSGASNAAQGSAKSSVALQDPEKGRLECEPTHHSHIQSAPSQYSQDTYSNDGELDDDDPKQHTLWILMYLSALSPVIALPVALYSLITATLLLILCPLCLCLEHWSFDARFHSLLSPPLVFQLRLIYSSYDTNVPADLNATRVIMLLLFNLFTPIYAMTIAVAAWVAAVFWFYTAILGNPDGSKEDRDDGREAVFGVRKWWETWLIQGLA